VTNQDVAGKTPADLSKRRSAQGVSLTLPGSEIIGDILTLVGTKPEIGAVATVLG
jgi:hypothetical protein